MKHTLCDLQEKIFHLQIQLLEEDIAGGETQPFYYTFIYLFCFLHNLLQSRGRCTRGRQHSRFHHKRGVERKEKTNRGARKAEVAHSSTQTLVEVQWVDSPGRGLSSFLHARPHLTRAPRSSAQCCTHTFTDGPTLHTPLTPQGFTPPPLAAGRSDRLLEMLLLLLLPALLYSNYSEF